MTSTMTRPVIVDSSMKRPAPSSGTIAALAPIVPAASALSDDVTGRNACVPHNRTNPAPALLSYVTLTNAAS